MPFIAVTVPAGTPESIRLGLAETFTRVVVDILGKRGEVTSVVVSEPTVCTWLVGAQPTRAAHAEITITAGTNSAEEKARAVREAHAALAAVLPGLPEATYVVIREIAAEAWGYGGLTQAARRVSRP